MPHLAFFCDCGVPAHLPWYAREGHVHTCRRCGSKFIVDRKGKRRGHLVASLPPRIKDITLRCRKCGRSFAFSAGEQRFFTARNLHTPRHCPACRNQAHRSCSLIQLCRKWLTGGK